MQLLAKQKGGAHIPMKEQMLHMADTQRLTNMEVENPEFVGLRMESSKKRSLSLPCDMFVTKRTSAPSNMSEWHQHLPISHAHSAMGIGQPCPRLFAAFHRLPHFGQLSERALHRALDGLDLSWNRSFGVLARAKEGETFSG